MDEAMGGGAKTLLQKEVWVMVTREDNGVAGPSAHPHSPPLERQLTMTIQKLQQAGGGEVGPFPRPRTSTQCSSCFHFCTCREMVAHGSAFANFNLQPKLTLKILIAL